MVDVNRLNNFNNNPFFEHLTGVEARALHGVDPINSPLSDVIEKTQFSGDTIYIYENPNGNYYTENRLLSDINIDDRDPLEKLKIIVTELVTKKNGPFSHANKNSFPYMIDIKKPHHERFIPDSYISYVLSTIPLQSSKDIEMIYVLTLYINLDEITFINNFMKSKKSTTKSTKKTTKSTNKTTKSRNKTTKSTKKSTNKTTKSTNKITKINKKLL